MTQPVMARTDGFQSALEEIRKAILDAADHHASPVAAGVVASSDQASGEVKSPDELTEFIATSTPCAGRDTELQAELRSRETNAKLQATEAKIAAAKAEQAAMAATATVELTAKNVKYMFWLVIAAAGSAIITAICVAYNVFNGAGG